MKFTLSWLKEHLDTDASVDEISEKLTAIGLEVEGVVDPAKTLAPFVIAYVEKAEKHPDADKLQVCTVNTGEETIQVVCGAPNARTGMKGVFAPNGAYVPGIDLNLKATKIRGVDSNGMLCSERELELSDEHNGIIDLPEDAPLGQKFADYAGLNDPVFEIAITPNRPDCLGVYGVARDLAAAGLGSLKSGDVEKIDGSYDSPVKVTLEFDAENKTACPTFYGRYVKGVKNGPSPSWMQRRLVAVGLRPINALVDITNYVSLDRARPLHVYDADKLNGSIRARMGRDNDAAFLALDGKEYKAADDQCVIADDEAVLGFGGIMGGEQSGSTEETVNVFIESAYFDPIRTAQTGRSTGIESDARYRFERGIDPASVELGIDLATKYVLEFCGGEASTVVRSGDIQSGPDNVEFRPSRVKGLAGIDVAEADMERILSALGFSVTGKMDGNWTLSVPSWRPDVHGEADIVEEVTRIVGLDDLPSTPLPRSHGVMKPVLTAVQNRVRLAKRVLAGRGMNECMTWSFMQQDHAELFGGGSAESKLANPISSELSTLRPSILPNLIAAVGRNIDRGFENVALFEVAAEFTGGKPGEQRLSASGVRRGATGGRSWIGEARPVDVFDAKADAMAVLAECGLNVAGIQIADKAPDYYHPGRSGVIQLGPKNILATFGELHPRILKAMDVDGPLVGFEIYPENIPAPKKKATRTRPAYVVSDYQAVSRDFAFVMDSAVTADKVLRAANGADKKLIRDCTIFDVYEGEHMEEDKKSVALSVTMQADDRTLKDEEIDTVAAKVVAAIEKTTGGTLRG